MKNKPKIKVPCPHCGKDIFPAQMLAHIRIRKMTKAERSAIASKGGMASKKARLLRVKRG